MPLLFASIRVTVSQHIFCFVAFRAEKPPGRSRNSASAAYRIVNVIIFDVGRCARSAVRDREHSLTRRPLWNCSRGRDNQCGCGYITAFHAQRVVCVLWVGDYEKRVLDGVPGQCDMLFIRPRRISRRGRRIDTYCQPPHE